MKKLLPLLLASSLFAHDLYLMPQKFRVAKGDSLLLSAHTGDSFPNSEQAVDPTRLTSIPALSPEGWKSLGKTTHHMVQVDSDGGQYYSIQTKPRLLEMEPVKFEEYLKEEGLNAPLALRKEKGESAAKSREMYAKYAKTYVVTGTPNSAWQKPVGLKIEIVPLADPATLKAGQTLPIRLLFNGKPLADTQVEMAVSINPKATTRTKIAGRTDSKGELKVTDLMEGKVRLHAVTMDRVKAADHEWESFWASFTFEVNPGSTNLSSR
jgi:uncharacterized GH25 family protein